MRCGIAPSEACSMTLEAISALQSAHADDPDIMTFADQAALERYLSNVH